MITPGITPVPALTAALQGLRGASRKFDQAAEAVAGATLADPSGATAPPDALASAPDLTSAMVEMMIAQRAFSAQLRVVEAADTMTRESIHLGDHPSA